MRKFDVHLMKGQVFSLRLVLANISQLRQGCANRTQNLEKFKLHAEHSLKPLYLVKQLCDTQFSFDITLLADG